MEGFERVVTKRASLKGAYREAFNQKMLMSKWSRWNAKSNKTGPSPSASSINDDHREMPSSSDIPISKTSADKLPASTYTADASSC